MFLPPSPPYIHLRPCRFQFLSVVQLNRHHTSDVITQQRASILGSGSLSQTDRPMQSLMSSFIAPVCVTLMEFTSSIQWMFNKAKMNKKRGV